MTDEETLSLISSFKELPDPRAEGRWDHRGSGVWGDRKFRQGQTGLAQGRFLWEPSISMYSGH